MRRWLWLLALWSCAACDSDSGAGGELGNGTFTYLCLGDDAYCDGFEETDTFPSIATGGVFEVMFDDHDEDGSAFELLSASSTILEKTGDRFHAVEPGRVALIARRLRDERVREVLHVDVVAPSELVIEEADGALPTFWVEGDSLELVVMPTDEIGATLAGSLDYTWTSSDASVVRLETGSPTRSMRVSAQGVGTATLRVTLGDLSETLEVTVE